MSEMILKKQKRNYHSIILECTKRYFMLAVLLAAVISGVFCLGGCSRAVKQETRTDFYLDTVVSITIYGNDSEQLFDGCMELADYYERLLSRTVEGSDIYNINQSGGQPVTVHDETKELLAIALDYAELSGGLLDPTIGALSVLWNFGDSNQKIVPTDEQIQEALSHVNYENIILQGNQVTLLDPKAKLDLGFIAKGYIADKIKEYLVSEHVDSAIINLGGNVLTVGQKPDGESFKIGVQQPFAENGVFAHILDIKNCSVASSGNYERYFEKDGVLYHHILSTEDGYPVNSGLSGVSIITEHSVDGDALSTLCFILGYEESKKLIDSLQNVKAVYITEDGEVL